MLQNKSRPDRFIFLFVASILSILLVLFVLKQRLLGEAALYFGLPFHTHNGTQQPVFGSLHAAILNGRRRLAFNEDGTFKLCVFEDLHFGEGEDNREDFPISQ